MKPTYRLGRFIVQQDAVGVRTRTRVPDDWVDANVVLQVKFAGTAPQEEGGDIWDVVKWQTADGLTVEVNPPALVVDRAFQHPLVGARVVDHANDRALGMVCAIVCISDGSYVVRVGDSLLDVEARAALVVSVLEQGL